MEETHPNAAEARIIADTFIEMMALNQRDAWQYLSDKNRIRGGIPFKRTIVRMINTTITHGVISNRDRNGVYLLLMDKPRITAKFPTNTLEKCFDKWYDDPI